MYPVKLITHTVHVTSVKHENLYLGAKSSAVICSIFTRVCVCVLEVSKLVLDRRWPRINFLFHGIPAKFHLSFSTRSNARAGAPKN